MAIHVDGLEWQRAKWAGAGRAYYRACEQLAVRWADALIADAEGIAEYYTTEFGASTHLISYGAPIIERGACDRLGDLGVTPGGYHLVVARFEPENHVDMIVRGYVASRAHLPLVVVGSAPYAHTHTETIHRAAAGDDRVRFAGGIWDQEQLDQLYANAATYIHGHSVGGTNPSLLRAIGAGANVLAYDVVFNREVLGVHGRYFTTPDGVAHGVETSETDPECARQRGDALQQHAARHYRWNDVADAYERLAVTLTDGETRRGEVSGRTVRQQGVLRVHKCAVTPLGHSGAHGD